MNIRYLRRVALAAMAVLIIAFVAFRPVTIPTADESGAPPADATAIPLPNIANTAARSMYGGAVTAQQFPAGGERIHSVALFLGTYRRENHGTLTVTIQSNVAGVWQELATQIVDKAEITDDAYHTITFSPALAVAKGQALQILVTSDGNTSNAIAWWVNADWQPAEYALFANGERQQGTARFLVSYAPVSGYLFQNLGPIWRRLTLFLDPLWQVVLVFGFCALAGASVLLGRHLMN